jgi:hypothetical protein
LSVSAQKACSDSIKHASDSIFGSAAAHGVTQKPTPLINQRASPQLAVNFSFTNQRADSFSPSEVNLEAKV